MDICTVPNHWPIKHFQCNLIAEEYLLALQARNYAENSSSVQWKISDLKAMFRGTLDETYKHILKALQCLCSSSDGHALPEESGGNITVSVKRFVALTENLQLNVICDDLTKMVNIAVSCINFSLHNVFGSLFHTKIFDFYSGRYGNL